MKIKKWHMGEENIKKWKRRKRIREREGSMWRRKSMDRQSRGSMWLVSLFGTRCERPWSPRANNIYLYIYIYIMICVNNIYIYIYWCVLNYYYFILSLLIITPHLPIVLFVIWFLVSHPHDCTSDVAKIRK